MSIEVLAKTIETNQKTVIETLAGLTEKQTEIQARLLAMEQKAARPRGDAGGGGSGDDGGGLRNLLEASAELKGMAEDRLRRAVIELPGDYFKKDIVSGAGVGYPEQRPAIVAMPQRRLTVRALIPSVPTTEGSIQYVRETAFTNAAATVSETILKAESNITFELKTAHVATIAHWIRASKQILDDVPQLLNHIDGRLRYGVALAEEAQLLKGSGVGNNLQGLATVGTAFSGSSAGTKVDVLRRALTQLEDYEMEATGIILHPHDWEAICLLKDTLGNYIIGEPGGAENSGTSPAMLWNLPVIATNSATAGNFVVADFPQAALIFDREASRVDISTETLDDFTTNRCHIRGEERLGLAILRTLAIIQGSFP